MKLSPANLKRARCYALALHSAQMAKLFAEHAERVREILPDEAKKSDERHATYRKMAEQFEEMGNAVKGE